VGDYLDAALLGGADPAFTVAVFELQAEGEPASRGVVYFQAAKNMRWPDPGLRAKVRRDGNGYVLDLHAAKFARAVWVDTGDADAELADNALTLLPGESVSLRLSSKAGLDSLRTSLSVRSLADALLFTKTR
jgi:beta-mannosidase